MDAFYRVGTFWVRSKMVLNCLDGKLHEVIIHRGQAEKLLSMRVGGLKCEHLQLEAT